MKKVLSIALAIMLIISMAACGTTDNQTETTTKADENGNEQTTTAAADLDTSDVSITILMGKPEVGSQFEKMLSEYSANTGVNVTMIPLAGQDAYEKMTSLYASGNAPSILMVGQEFEEFQDKFLDLSNTDFIAKAGEGTLDFVTVDGKIFGAPTTVEAYGIIYNPAVVEKALGTGFDSSEIKTIDDLKDFFESLKNAGVGPFTLSPMDWSLGAHLSNTVYAAQSDSHEERHEFIEKLKAGEVSLAENDIFNGWVDVFDLMLEYNIHSSSPLSPVYEDGSLDLAVGDAASWFMGNWAYPELVAIDDQDYRFIPIPVSNNEQDYANGKIAIGVPSYWCVDASGNNEAQQKASLDFLSWFITTAEGQKYYVEELNFIPAYSGFEIEPSDAMSVQIVDMLNSGDSLEWMNTYYPAGGFQAMGAAMQKYIDGVIDRAELAQEFEEYWESVE
ncbi:MAG: maltose transport system substrate-binding protein [Clostridiales bacterium]|jgi:raffinose/stachyose/melibiose transport system substrate-binding protein|nr:maltose transport system substrate-binding protein [Clostridiales bacterium]